MTHFPSASCPGLPSLPSLPSLPRGGRPWQPSPSDTSTEWQQLLPTLPQPPSPLPGTRGDQILLLAVQVRKLVPGWGGTCPGSQGEGTARTRALAADPVLSFALGHADSSFLALLTSAGQRDKSLSVWQRSVGPAVPPQTDRQ